MNTLCLFIFNTALYIAEDSYNHINHADACKFDC